MRLYHFTKYNNALKILEGRKLLISRISEVNDPFEFQNVPANDQKMARKLSVWKEEENEKQGFISFSKSWQSPVCWAHYAENHEGVCFEFEVENLDLYEVIYQETRTDKPILSSIGKPEWSDEALNHIIATKSHTWQYEQEFRLFCSLNEDCRDTNIQKHMYFEKFSQAIELKKVFFGLRMKNKHCENVLKAIEKFNYQGCSTQQVVMSDTDYLMM